MLFCPYLLLHLCVFFIVNYPYQQMHKYIYILKYFIFITYYPYQQMHKHLY